MTSLIPFWCLYFMMPLHISHVIVESYCWYWAGKCLLGAHVTNLIYPRGEWRHRSTVFIFNFEHISHLILVLLLLILSMYLIARFGVVYSLLETISTKWNVHPIASSSKQDIFIINFNVNCNVNFFLSFLSFDKWDEFASLNLFNKHNLQK